MMNLHERILKLYTEKRKLFVMGVSVLVYIILMFAIMGIYSGQPFATQTTNRQSVVMPTFRNLETIAQWHLFGANEIDKFSNSSIELIGIIYQDNTSKAIMLVNSQERVFKIGDNIISNFKIQSIEPSRIIISTSDGLKQLGLFEQIEQKAPNNSAITNNAGNNSFSSQDYNNNIENTDNAVDNTDDSRSENNISPNRKIYGMMRE